MEKWMEQKTEALDYQMFWHQNKVISFSNVSFNTIFYKLFKVPSYFKKFPSYLFANVI